jgi:polyisoprenyl-teichoic acid--peptidoglycan teichoic acid transferase
LKPPDGEGRRQGGEGVPDLDPQFADALREAAGRPAGESRRPAEGDGAVAEQSAEVDRAVAEQSTEVDGPAVEPSEVEEPAGEPGDTVEYAPGEAPDEEPDGEEEAAEPAPDPTLISHRGRAEARTAIAEAARTGEPWAPTAPPVSGDSEPPPKRRRLWLRFAFGALLIIASFAGATSATGLLRLNKWLNEMQPVGEAVERQLTEVDGGEPQTFLILGSDRRVSDGSLGLSDTTILLRLDPDRNLIALLNIPRDLKVYIPGVGVDKFNSAYSYGGPKLTLRTVKRLTRGMGLQINHLVNINFLGFAQAINALDCVYIDVDRRYYHSNAGLPAELQYDEINLQPGYQRLCGEDALDYARYRHTDTDLVRAARQQDFLREARQRVPPSELFKELRGDGDLISIFTTHTQSDIDDASTVVQVLKLLIEARSAPIREIRFPAVLGPSYVYASRPAIKKTIGEFLGFELQSGPRGSLNEAAPPSEPKREPRKDRKPRDVGSASPPQDDGLVDASGFGRQMGRGIAREVGADFHVFYPRRLPAGTVYDQTPRAYHLKDTGGDGHEAYKIVLTVGLPDGMHYFGVQGVRGWDDPPILRNPSETREIGGREYDIYVTGDRVRLVAWRDGENSYWVSNSLLRTLTNDQMIGIARSMGEVIPKPKDGPKPRKGKRK